VRLYGHSLSVRLISLARARLAMLRVQSCSTEVTKRSFRASITSCFRFFFAISSSPCASYLRGGV
ncbi:MAG TPA: hypothetical protein VHZ95_14755, partial [Polyangiales bacterium]|nr:hypothetical protein [Polyangiales bacterium]